MERADSRAMQTQGLSVDSREADAALGALDRTTCTPAGLARTLAESLQRPLAVVLSLQLALSVALVVLMAVRSAGNAHPDEISHFQAARYFRTHWLPPAVGAPGTESSYSVYGFSYLNEADIVYWAFGKAAVVGELVGMGTGLAMRLLQLMLYAGLVTWTMFRARRFAPALGFLVLTPQVWYVFSYINGDALPFALLTVLLIELGCPDSSVRRFLKGAQARPTPAVLVVGALLGLLAISKRNYLVSFVFLGWVILWLRSEVRSWRRVAVLTSIAAVIALPWLTYHAWMNDWETEKRVADYSELVASPDLKPSVQAGPHSSPYRALRAKGASLWDVVVTLPWVDHSFRSFCGLYGWMDTVADPWVYRVFGGLYAALLAMLVIPSLREGSPRSVPVDRRSGRRHARSRAINLPILGVRLPGAGTVPVSHSPDAVLLLATVRDSASTRPGARRGDAARDPRALLLRSDRPRPPRLRTEPRPSLPAARETSALAVVLQRLNCLRRECR